MTSTDTLFKCCSKSKKTENYFCIECCNIFHKSCTEKLTFQIIDRHKILCSKKCNEKYTLKDDLIDNLKANVNKLTQEKVTALEDISNQHQLELSNLQSEIEALNQKIRDKDLQLKRERTRTQDFTDDVFEAENKFVQQLKQKSDIILELNKEMTDIKTDNKKLTLEISSVKFEYETTKNQLSELNQLNRNMVDSIRMLEHDISRYTDEISKLKNEIQKNDSLQREKACGCTVASISEKNKYVKKQKVHTEKNPQILIVGDQKSVVGCASLFKMFNEKKCDINCQFRKKPLFSEIVTETVLYSRHLTRNDYIVVFIGCENALRGISIKQTEIEELLTVSNRTNLFVVGPPFADDRSVLNRLISDNNKLVSECVRQDSNSAMFLHLDSFMHEFERSTYAEPSYNGKRLVCKFICSRMYCLGLEKNSAVNREDASDNSSNSNTYDTASGPNHFLGHT